MAASTTRCPCSDIIATKVAHSCIAKVCLSGFKT